MNYENEMGKKFIANILDNIDIISAENIEDKFPKDILNIIGAYGYEDQNGLCDFCKDICFDSSEGCSCEICGKFGHSIGERDYCEKGIRRGFVEVHIEDVIHMLVVCTDCFKKKLQKIRSKKGYKINKYKLKKNVIVKNL